MTCITLNESGNYFHLFSCDVYMFVAFLLVQSYCSTNGSFTECMNILISESDSSEGGGGGEEEVDGERRAGERVKSREVSGSRRAEREDKTAERMR